MSKLTHIDHTGSAVMVDVSHKSDTSRVAIARGEIHMTKATLDLIRAGQMKKGDVLTVAQIGHHRFIQEELYKSNRYFGLAPDERHYRLSLRTFLGIPIHMTSNLTK